MPWNLLIIPLICGYFLLTRSFCFKFRQQRLDQQRLVFESVFIGTVLTISTYIIRMLLEQWSFAKKVILLTYDYLPIKLPFTGTAIFVLIITLIAWGWNIFLDKKKWIYKAIDEIGNDLEKTIKHSMVKRRALQITLSTGKVYVGFIKEPSIPAHYNYIRIYPQYSGVRDDKTKEVYISTEYLSVTRPILNQISENQEILKNDSKNEVALRKLKSLMSELNEIDLDVTIPLDKIVTVSYFDDLLFAKWNPKGFLQPKESDKEKLTLEGSSIINIFRSYKPK